MTARISNLRRIPPVTVLRCCALLVLAAPITALRSQATSDTTSLSPVIITAARVPTSAVVSTATTTLISDAELRARGVTTLQQALRTVPGMSLSQTAGPGSQSSLFLRGGNSNFTKVLLDGVPVNTPGGALDIATLTTDNIDRIEIVRGPASAQYGSDAMTGVIQIFTRREPGTTVSARRASRDAQYDLVGGASRTTQLHGSTRLLATLGGGLHRGNGFLPFNNQYRNATASLLASAAGAGGDLTLTAALGDSRYHYPTTGGGTPTDSNAYTGANRLTFGLNGSRPVGPRLTARARLGRADSRSISDDRADNAGDSLGFYSRSHARAIRDDADVQLVATLPATITALVGGAVERQSVASRGWSQFQRYTAEVTSFDETRTNRALYAQLSAGRALFTTDAGVRHERLANGRVVTTGRAGAASELLPGTVLRASLGTGFKEPAFDEIFNGPFSKGGRDLRPERTRSAEIGAESRLPGGALTLGVTMFDQRFTDLVQYRDIDRSVDTTTANYDNIVAARARGLEVEARTASFRGFAVHGSYSFLHTEVTNEGNGGFGAAANGKPLLRRPRRTAVADAVYATPRLTISALANRVGARDDYFFGFPGARVRLAPYTLVEAAAELPLIRAGDGRFALALTARGENLTDRRYQNVYGFRTPGRVIFIGVRMND